MLFSLYRPSSAPRYVRYRHLTDYLLAKNMEWKENEKYSAPGITFYNTELFDFFRVTVAHADPNPDREEINMNAKRRFSLVFLLVAMSLIMAASPVFSQQCTEVPGTRYNMNNVNRWLAEANQFLGRCSGSNYNDCREADKRLGEADVAIVQILTECTRGNCLRGRLDTLAGAAGRLAELSRRLVRQSGMRRTYDNTLVTVNSWRSTRMCPTARCRQYATMAVSHNQENLRRRCGFTGTRWTSEYKGHYDWCFTAPQSLADAETKARADALRQCQSRPDHGPRCRQYASTAVSQNQENLARKCGFTGTRWTSDYQGHYKWCMGVQQSYASSETLARANALRQCQSRPDHGPRCQKYASTAVSQNRENQLRRCGYTGARWTGDYQGHYKWCMSASQSLADSETMARANALRQCKPQPNNGPRCQQYASTAVSQNQENLRRKCGYTGARWTSDYQGHFRWCMAAPLDTASSETMARTDALNKCKPQAQVRSCPGPGMTVIHKLVNPPPYTGYSVICRDSSGKLWMQGANAAPVTSIVKEQWNNQTGCYDRSRVVTPSGTLAGRLCKP